MDLFWVSCTSWVARLLICMFAVLGWLLALHIPHELWLLRGSSKKTILYEIYSFSYKYHYSGYTSPVIHQSQSSVQEFDIWWCSRQNPSDSWYRASIVWWKALSDWLMNRADHYSLLKYYLSRLCALYLTGLEEVYSESSVISLWSRIATEVIKLLHAEWSRLPSLLSTTGRSFPSVDFSGLSHQIPFSPCHVLDLLWNGFIIPSSMIAIPV